MVSPLLLIAEREFRTYVATLSFWLSLALAPLAAGAATLFFPSHPPPVVTISGGDTLLARSVVSALRQAGQVEGKQFVFAPGGAQLRLSQPSPAHLDLDFASGFPLSNTGRALMGMVLERDAALRILPGRPLAVRARAEPAPGGMNSVAQTRLITMTALWLTLTGSLGMLLQAVVRERANRALESLLASAEGWEIVAGKILGVGAVSLLVLSVWGATAASLSVFAGSGPLAGMAALLSDPLALAYDALIYLCAFFFYGALTVMVGAMARDSASAQNLARPLFVILLLGFLAALSTLGGASAALSWLVWLPPFTPFMLLMQNNPYTVASWAHAAPLLILALASLTLLRLSAGTLSVAPPTYKIFGGRGKNIPAVG